MELNKIYEGDCLSVLKTFESESIDLIVTSPPYYGLRDYGIEGQIGREKTPQQYIQNLMAIMDECKRVLKKTGSCWVNIGDSYNKNKSLVGIPSKFVESMEESNWIRRNDIIWYKPVVMPSTAKDRFIVDFEYFYFFVKNPRYYFDIQYEPRITPIEKDIQRIKGQRTQSYRSKYTDQRGFDKPVSKEWIPKNEGRRKRSVWKVSFQPFPQAHFAVFPEKLVETPIKACCPPVNGVVLDPFFGSGTVGVVAKKLGRNYVGIELNQDYIKMAQNRLNSIL